MLIVFIEYRGRVIYINAFKDHKEAIKHYSEIEVCSWMDDEAHVRLTNREFVPLGEKPPIFYVS